MPDADDELAGGAVVLHVVMCLGHLLQAVVGAVCGEGQPAGRDRVEDVLEGLPGTPSDGSPLPRSLLMTDTDDHFPCGDSRSRHAPADLREGAFMQVSVVRGCGLLSGVRRFESCRGAPKNEHVIEKITIWT